MLTSEVRNYKKELPYLEKQKAMPSKHAKYSPSSAERWFACPGSIKLSEGVAREPVGLPALTGTMIHNMAEMLMKGHLEGVSLEDYWLGKTEVVEDVELVVEQDHVDCAKVYVDYVEGRAKELDAKLLVEEQVSIEEINPECWGTSDAIIFNKDVIEVVDLKTGKWPVSPENNLQMSIYALGALARYGNENMKVIMTIVQPRAKNSVRSHETNAEYLVDWGFDKLKTALDNCEADEPNYSFGEQCRFCPAKKICPTYKQHGGNNV